MRKFDSMSEMAKQLNDKTFFESKLIKNFRVDKIHIDEEKAKLLKKHEGDYTILTFEKDNFNEKDLISILKGILKTYIDTSRNTLITALGNPELIADSFGFEALRGIDITSKKGKKIYKLNANVEGVSGIDSALHIDAICNILKPEQIIMADSMVSGETKNLLSTIQISNTPFDILTGENNKEITYLNKDINVVSIGYSTCIPSDNSIAPKQGFFFSFNEKELLCPVQTDLCVKKISLCIAKAVNNFFSAEKL